MLPRSLPHASLVSKEFSAEQVLFLERTLEAHLGVRIGSFPVSSRTRARTDNYCLQVR
ncbi:hypothetical protein ACN28S_60255 [Cystobacter fuscus]